MEPQSPSLLADILDKAQALIAAKIVSIKEYGEEILPEKDGPSQYSRAYGWLVQRDANPSGEYALRIKLFTEKKIKQLKGADGYLFIETLKQIKGKKPI